ncbi:MAG: hypothetical protein SAK29_38030 [Scytonema sp. PMC 1069.18]|nr:hypothetical protein [Scytonema sp. PMC 1069.18]MEC4885184.1 hypothetical protein [Scytonema sp. PMC 1070.18]
MPIEHINRKGQTYYLHQGTTKTGKQKYFFSMKNQGTLVETIPDGYEIYENPNAQVFLRKVQSKIITDDEITIVKEGIKKNSSLKSYQVDVKKNTIIVYTPNQDIDVLSSILNSDSIAPRADAQDVLSRSITYSPMLQFILVDEEKRLFITQRYCFLGSIDDWIYIGTDDTLQNLVERYVQHLGHESYYELH